MIVTDAMKQINWAYRGTDDDPPTEDTPDYDLWLGTINRKINEWARDGKNDWASLFDIRQIGTIALNTQTYELDDDILIPAKDIYLTNADNQKSHYTIGKPQEKGRFYNNAYIYGQDPQQLVFEDNFATGSTHIGETINVAGYYIPDDLTSENDEIPVDDPYWVVYSVASELAFNDLTYSDKAPDLVGKANFIYSQMASNNRRGTSGNPRTAQTNVDRIRGTTYERYR